jgi:hypothetical protein
MKIRGSDIPRNPTTRRMTRYERVYALSRLPRYLLCVFSRIVALWVAMARLLISAK